MGRRAGATARHDVPSRTAGGPASSTAQAGRTDNPYGLLEPDRPNEACVPDEAEGADDQPEEAHEVLDRLQARKILNHFSIAVGAHKLADARRALTELAEEHTQLSTRSTPLNR